MARVHEKCILQKRRPVAGIIGHAAAGLFAAFRSVRRPAVQLTQLRQLVGDLDLQPALDRSVELRIAQLVRQIGLARSEGACSSCA